MQKAIERHSQFLAIELRLIVILRSLCWTWRHWQKRVSRLLIISWRLARLGLPNDEELVFWESGSTDDAGNTLSVERIFKVDLNILFTTPLTGENDASWQPVWSPSGDQIVFAEFDGSDWELILIDADGQNRVQLTDNETVDWEPAWSPDGTKIAYSDRNNIFVMNSDGTDKAQITVGGRRSIEPSLVTRWHRDRILSLESGRG